MIPATPEASKRKKKKKTLMKSGQLSKYLGHKVKYMGNKVKYLGNKVYIWAIKCYFIVQILAENRAVKTQEGRQLIIILSHDLTSVSSVQSLISIIVQKKKKVPQRLQTAFLLHEMRALYPLYRQSTAVGQNRTEKYNIVV
jgi:hypothetical protein